METYNDQNIYVYRKWSDGFQEIFSGAVVPDNGIIDCIWHKPDLFVDSKYKVFVQVSDKTPTDGHLSVSSVNDITRSGCKIAVAYNGYYQPGLYVSIYACGY